MNLKVSLTVLILAFATQAMASFSTHCKGTYSSANGSEEKLEFTEKSGRAYDPYSNDFYVIEKELETADSRLSIRLYAAKYGDTATYITVKELESNEEFKGQSSNREAAIVRINTDGLKFELTCKSKSKRLF